MQDVVTSFAALIDNGGRVVRMLEAAQSMPQAHTPEGQAWLEKLRLERAAALADVAAFAVRNAQFLLPGLITAAPAPQPAQPVTVEAPDPGFVTYETQAPTHPANPFLDRLR